MRHEPLPPCTNTTNRPFQLDPVRVLAGALAPHEAPGGQRAGRHVQDARIPVRGARAGQERHAGAARQGRLHPQEADIRDPEGEERAGVAAAQDEGGDGQGAEGDPDAGGGAPGEDRRAEALRDQAGEQGLQVGCKLDLSATRISRCARPGYELARDEPEVGLKEEVQQLRRTRRDLREKIDCAKATFNALEDQQVAIDRDLQCKCQSLMTDIRCLDLRMRLRTGEFSGPATDTDRNIELTRMEKEIPPT